MGFLNIAHADARHHQLNKAPDDNAALIHRHCEGINLDISNN